MSELWERLSPGFLAPIWLAVGAVAIIAVVLLEWGAERRRSQALRMFAASHLISGLTQSISIFKRMLKRVLLVAAVGLLFLAMARPHLFYRWDEEKRTGLDVLLALDCSKSMLTEDAKPNRLDRAKLAVEDFTNRLPDNRLGLVAFAGDAFLECPLTLDHGAFLEALRDLDTETIPRPGTDIATAIDEALVALKSQPNNLKFMILITDGEDLEGRVLDAAKNAAQAGLRIYTVGVGTGPGGPIPLRDESGSIAFLRDGSGEVIQSKLDENMLRKIAQITGGEYEPLGDKGEGLETIYDRFIAPLPKQHLEEKRRKIPYEWFEWPLAAATFLLIVEFLLRERAVVTVPVPPRPGRMTRKTSTSLAGVSTFFLFAFLGQSSGFGATTDAAEREYKAGRYEDAAQQYRDALRAQPDRRELDYNHGDAAYKAGQYNEAEEAFRKALETPNLTLQENSYYNLGNAQFKDGEGLEKADKLKTQELWEQSLHSYESALKLRDSPDTQHNYELVKKKLEKLKQEQQQQQKNQKNQKKDQGDQSQQNQGGSGNQDKNQKNNPDKKPQDQKGNSPNDQPQNQPSPGDNQQPEQQPSAAQQQKKDSSGLTRQSARSQSRDMDQNDPGVKNRQEAEALLDSSKDSEHRVSARSLNGDNLPPPTSSGKDW